MDTESGSSRKWAEKSEIERTLLASLNAAPQIKADEKREYLGVFREQVLVKLSLAQVLERAMYPEVLHALQDHRAVKMIYNGKLSLSAVEKYRDAAKMQGRTCSMVTGTEFADDSGLVVASNDVVNVESVEPQSRTDRLLAAGLSQAQVNATGKAVCDTCYTQIIQADPDEKVNYTHLQWIDRVLGEECPAHGQEFRKS